MQGEQNIASCGSMQSRQQKSSAARPQIHKYNSSLGGEKKSKKPGNVTNAKTNKTNKNDLGVPNFYFFISLNFY